MTGTGLKYQFARLNIAEKLIVINSAVFILNGAAVFLLQWPENFIVRWFQLPKDLSDFVAQPWSLVTYSFFHDDFWHIFSNMIMLYFFGRIFLNLFDARRFINVYFLGIIAGGLVFLLSYNIFPALSKYYSVLIGASAGVMAILIFVCTYIPNREVRIIFFNVKLWHIGVFFVLLDLIRIQYGANVGGRLAHLGGVFLGYMYARQLTKGRDIGDGFARMLTALGNLFKRREKTPLKTIYKKKTKKNTKSKVDYTKETRQRKIDAILDKISRSGYESLSKAEKDFLFKAGKED